MKSEEFVPVERFSRLLEKWWQPVLAALLGGIAGFLISFLLPPRFEAFAQISSQLDYTVASQLEDYEENRAVNEVGWVCVLDPVFNEVERLINAEGYVINRGVMLDAFSVERTDDLWNLRVIHEDSQTAALFANIWVDKCYRQLTEAYGHALQAESLQTYIDALSTCTELPPQEAAGVKICNFEDPAALAAELENKTSMLQDELALARLLHPDLQFNLVAHAQVPQTPTRRVQPALTFAGAMLAFILSIVWLLVQGKKESRNG